MPWDSQPEKAHRDTPEDSVIPCISILVPTFNRSHYLRECLDSLLATTVDCEIIVADNGSSDGTPALMASYSDARIRYYRHDENLGFLANSNFLLGKAEGKYVCFFGDDDRALPGCFEPKIALLESHPHIDVVHSLISPMDAQGIVRAGAEVFGRFHHGYVGGRDEFQELFVNCYISWQSLVFRRELLEEVGDLADGWGLHVSFDWYWLQKLMRGRQTAFIPRATVCVRFHAESYTEKEAMGQGNFSTDRWIIWRRWLLEHPHPPIISEAMWERMVRVVRGDILHGQGDSPGALDAAMQKLATLQTAYRLRMNDRLGAAIGQGDPFKSGLPPWPLDAVGRRNIVYFPVWDEPQWRRVLASYLETFSSADNVTLVLARDPRQHVGAAEVEARVTAALLEWDEGEAPDLLLVTDLEDDEACARLYAASDTVLALNDHLEALRAKRMGKKVQTSWTREAWLQD